FHCFIRFLFVPSILDGRMYIFGHLWSTSRRHTEEIAAPLVATSCSPLTGERLSSSASYSQLRSSFYSTSELRVSSRQRRGLNPQTYIERRHFTRLLLEPQADTNARGCHNRETTAGRVTSCPPIPLRQQRCRRNSRPKTRPAFHFDSAGTALLDKRQGGQNTS
ncbi:unnamed protein product, partial [Ectocarpus fasciculatus]